MSNKNKTFLFISDPFDMATGVAGQSLMLALALRERGYRCLNLAAYPAEVPVDRLPYRFLDDEGKWQVANVKFPTFEHLLDGRAVAMIPCSGFGDPRRIPLIIDAIKRHTGDQVEIVMVTDPRFYRPFWPTANALRTLGVKIHYWHVWDNGPTPLFNKYLGDVVDSLCCISRTTQLGLEQAVDDKSKVFYLPHGLDERGPFVPIVETDQQRHALRAKWFGKSYSNKLVVFWDNKNFWRKMPGQLLFAFSLAIKDDPNLLLVMKTSPYPQSGEIGQDLVTMATNLGLVIGENVVFVDKEVSFPELNEMYNAVDVTINISHSEGFGLSTLCSMFAGTPIIAVATGGLRDQLEVPTVYEPGGIELLDGVVPCTSGQGWVIWPANRNITGSPPAPYIYEEHTSFNAVRAAIVIAAKTLRDSGPLHRIRAREFALKNFNLKDVVDKFISCVEREIAPYSGKQISFSMPLQAKENKMVRGIIDAKNEQ